jgi:DNA-binding NarL/FixJ family response regulator
MRILLVDDHGLFVEGLRNLLQAGGYEVVGAAYDGLEALQLARELHPDLIFMDIRMPNLDGLKATRLIMSEIPDIQIIMLTTSAEDSDLYEALKSGASGYLLKNLKPNVLFSYLEGLTRGESPLSRELCACLLREFTHQSAVLDGDTREILEPDKQKDIDIEFQPPEARPGEITARQFEILEMVATGMTYKEVGAALDISENTVKYHMGEIINRLHVKNREQVVAYAVRTGLVHLQAGGR